METLSTRSRAGVAATCSQLSPVGSHGTFSSIKLEWFTIIPRGDVGSRRRAPRSSVPADRDYRWAGTVLFERSPGDGGRLPARQQPPGGGGGQRQAGDDDDEVGEGHMSEDVQVASMPGHEAEVGAGGPEQGTEEGEGACGGSGEGAAGGAAGAGGGEGP